MQRGLYPGSWHKGALGVGAGKIQDDASNEKHAYSGNSYTYKACPESVSKVEEQIREEKACLELLRKMKQEQETMTQLQKELQAATEAKEQLQK